MSSIDISIQTVSFLYSLLLGVALAVCYDFIRVSHKTTIKSILLIQIIDVLFFVVSALVSFGFFMLYSNGYIRVYLLLGELLGFVFWNLTFSEIFQKSLLFFIKFLIKIICLLCKPLSFLAKQGKKILFRLKNKIISQKSLENQSQDVV